MPRRRVSFFLDEDLAEGLARLKDRDGILAAEAMRRAIGEYLERRQITVTNKADRTPLTPFLKQHLERAARSRLHGLEQILEQHAVKTGPRGTPVVKKKSDRTRAVTRKRS